MPEGGAELCCYALPLPLGKFSNFKSQSHGKETYIFILVIGAINRPTEIIHKKYLVCNILSDQLLRINYIGEHK